MSEQRQGEFDFPDQQEWWHVGKLDDLPRDRGYLFSREGHEIALFRLGDQVYAIDDYCPHMGDSLSAGQIYLGAVVCPRHFWAFRLEDGQCLDVATLRARTYPVRIHQGQVFIKKPDKKAEMPQVS